MTTLHGYANIDQRAKDKMSEVGGWTKDDGLRKREKGQMSEFG
jgi:hypothetical protein